MSAHHFEDHHAVVRFGGGVESIECFGGNVERGNEAKCQLSRRKIVIDCFRHTNHRKTSPVKLSGDGERTLSTEHNQRLDSQSREILECLPITLISLRVAALSIAIDETSSVSRSENRSPARQKSTDVR